MANREPAFVVLVFKLFLKLRIAKEPCSRDSLHENRWILVKFEKRLFGVRL